MKIVIDTNVFISGVFFGGFPKQILKAIVDKTFIGCATPEIIEEYQAIVSEMIARKQGHLNTDFMTIFLNALNLIDPVSKINVCRDPDDDKFLECAKDAKALFIVSGDKDLLVLETFENIEIITAKEFCLKFLT